MNKVFLIGNLTKDVELRQTQNGKAVATFSIAVSRQFQKDVTDYFNIVVWGESANHCAKYLNKGKKVAVAGAIQNRSYDDKNGKKVYVTEIIADNVEFLTPKSNTAENAAKTPPNSEELTPVEDEEIPF